MSGAGRFAAVCFACLLAAGSRAEDPLPGRTKPPKGATAVLEWSAVIDGTINALFAVTWQWWGT